MKLLRNWVIPASTPRMAAQQTTASQIESFERTMHLDSINCVLGTRRCETTRGRQHWGDCHTIETNGKQQEEGNARTDTRQQEREDFHKH